MKISLLAPIALALILAIAGFVFRFFSPTYEESAMVEHLDDYIPTEVQGWEARDLPLGPNEFASDRAERILKFDEFLYREFTRGDIEFAVYIAHWGRGRMPIRDVNTHNPDRCWTENGWACTDMVFNKDLELMGKSFQPGEWRIFEDVEGREIYVMFWHLVEGEVYDFGERFNAIPHPSRWVRDVFYQAFRGSPEQYFIRITANVPLEEIWYEDPVLQVMDGLYRLGVGRSHVERELAAVAKPN
ncbi:MAG: hypothetical protein LAT55_11195 [Opitutales bacterium]|nr:hypothetical protein [Opitutales bacterium]